MHQADQSGSACRDGAKPKPTGLDWGRREQGGGTECCQMYPVSHQHIFIYIRRTLGVPVCVYTVCVCIYIYMLYI